MPVSREKELKLFEIAPFSPLVTIDKLAGMESGRNNNPKPERPPLQFSTQVGSGHPRAEQHSPAPSPVPLPTKTTNATVATQGKAADSNLHHSPSTIDYW